MIASGYIRLIGWVSHHQVGGRWALIAPAGAFGVLALVGFAIMIPLLLLATVTATAVARRFDGTRSTPRDCGPTRHPLTAPRPARLAGPSDELVACLLVR
jgi:hypothetical protein